MTSADIEDKTTAQSNTDLNSNHTSLADDSFKEDNHVVFEPVDQNIYYLTYACLLIPRFKAHTLAGDLSMQLPLWMQQVCISFGWRLGYLHIKPDYLQWTLSVPPAISPAYFMRNIRRQTSLFIFEEFPRFKRLNVSDDFWAPGYLIYFGTELHPIEVIQGFIQQTRRQQGIIFND